LVSGPNVSLWLLVILWGNDDRQRYYLVAFPENRSGPKAEIHEVHPSTSGLLLGWRYAPRKGDGRNPERVALFEKTMGSAVAYFDATLKRKDLTAFLDDVFFAVRSRLLADDLQAVRPKRRGQPGKSETGHIIAPGSRVSTYRAVQFSGASSLASLRWRTKRPAPPPSPF
jgi:hypothetical protein